MRYIGWFLMYSSIVSCSVPKIEVTEEYLYTEGGIVNGFTIYLIDVIEFSDRYYL